MVRAAVSMDIDVDSRDVERMLMAVNTVVSPLGMMGFLNTVAGPYVQRRAKARFANEGDDVSGKWAPLEPVTQDIRARQNFGPDHPINRRTGELEDYITQSNSDVFSLGASGAQLTYPSASSTGGPWLDRKVETAQQGRRSPRTVPRPVLGLNVQDLAYVIGGIGIAIKSAAGYR